MSKTEGSAQYITEKANFIERRMMAADMRCPEAIRMYDELLYSYDARGDGTWPLRQARDVHVTIVRALMKTYKCEIEDAMKMSLCAWFEAWRRTDVNEEGSESGRHMRHVHKLLSVSESTEDPQPPEACLMMKHVSRERLKSEKNLLDLAEFSHLTRFTWAALELQTFMAKTSDDAVYECVYHIHGT